MSSPCSSVRIWHCAATIFLLSILLLPHLAMSRKLCGQLLTNELKRVCTKEGMKGPCIHGAVPSPHKRGSRLTLSTPPSVSDFRAHFRRFLMDNKREGATGFVPAPAVWWPGMVMPVFRGPPKNIRAKRFTAIPDAAKQWRMKRAKGIVDQCCSADGCDETFLDSYCCDEAEEKEFRAASNR